MSTYLFTRTDYTAALLTLLPRGRVWPKGLDSIQNGAVACFAPTFERSGFAGIDLLTDAFPATALNLLPEWEQTLGLPDPCAGPAPTLQARRKQVVSRLTNDGGQSIAYMIGVAAKLGYTITITQYAPFRCGQNVCGQQLGTEDWFYTWAVNAPLNTVVHFSAGQSCAGEPLSSWGNAVLECELAAVAPAHTILQFHYS